MRRTELIHAEKSTFNRGNSGSFAEKHRIKLSDELYRQPLQRTLLSLSALVVTFQV